MIAPRLALLRLRGRLELRGRVQIERGARISVARGARVLLEDGCRLGAGARIEANGGTVRIGPGASIGERSVLVALAGIDVGAGAVVGDWAVVSDTEPTFADAERPTRLQPLRAVPVRIGDGARIGLHAIVAPGTTIAPGAVVEPYETGAPRRSA